MNMNVDAKENDACILCGAHGSLRTMTAIVAKRTMFAKTIKLPFPLCEKCLRELTVSFKPKSFAVVAVFAVAMLLWAIVLMEPYGIRWQHPWIPHEGFFDHLLKVACYIVIPCVLFAFFRPSALAQAPFFDSYRVGNFGFQMLGRVKFPQFLYAYGLVCCLMIASLVLQGHYEAQNGEISRWHRTIGRVNSVEQKNCGNQMFWRYCYSYQVDGTEHHGAWVDYFDVLKFQHTKCAYRKKLVDKNDIMVFYCPKDHSKSVLTKLNSPPEHMITYLAITSVFFVFFLFLFCFNVGKRLDERYGKRAEDAMAGMAAISPVAGKIASFRRMFVMLAIGAPITVCVGMLMMLGGISLFMESAYLTALALALLSAVGAWLCHASESVRACVLRRCGTFDRCFKRMALYAPIIGFVAYGVYTAIPYLSLFR